MSSIEVLVESHKSLQFMDLRTPIQLDNDTEPIQSYNMLPRMRASAKIRLQTVEHGQQPNGKRILKAKSTLEFSIQ